MILTSRQVRGAWLLMGLQHSKLADHMRIPTALVKLAESANEDFPLTLKRAAAFCSYFEDRMVKIIVEHNMSKAQLTINSMLRGSPYQQGKPRP